MNVISDCSIRVSQAFSGIIYSANFLTIKLLLSLQNAIKVPDIIPSFIAASITSPQFSSQYC